MSVCVASPLNVSYARNTMPIVTRPMTFAPVPPRKRKINTVNSENVLRNVAQTASNRSAIAHHDRCLRHVLVLLEPPLLGLESATLCVDVLASVVDGDAKRLDSAGATVAGAFELATREAPVVSGFVAGVALSWLLGLGKDAQIEAQSREIARLKKTLDDVTGLKKLVGLEKA